MATQRVLIVVLLGALVLCVYRAWQVSDIVPQQDHQHMHVQSTSHPRIPPWQKTRIRSSSGIKLLSLSRTRAVRPPNNIVSMSAYGTDPRYTEGVVRNAQLIHGGRVFRGWKMRVYTAAPNTTVPQLPPNVTAQLTKLQVDFVYVNASAINIPPMMWRFMVADDTTVDRFIVRDVDSRLSHRDEAAVRQWINSGKALHCIRDHPSHAHYTLSGGLWGGRPKLMRAKLKTTLHNLMVKNTYSNKYMQDMVFLDKQVWPAFKKESAYCSDSVSCHKYPSSYPYPAMRKGGEHVGQVFDKDDVPRKVDIDIIRQTPVVEQCVKGLEL